MKKIFLLFLIAASFASCDNIRRKNKIADDAGTKMAMALKDSTTVQLIDSVYNFGKIKQGQSVTFNFRFKNTGKRALVVTDASASCGCTVPEKPEHPIMPGESSFIKVIFNSTGKSGHQEKNVTISANTNPAFPAIKLTGEVDAPKQ
jgi:hypothetical protein